MVSLNNKDWVDQILTLLIVVLAVIGIVSLILKLTNHSPVDITILYSLVAMIIVSAFKLHYDRGRLHEFSDNTKTSFQHIREDIHELKNILKEKNEV